MTASAIVFAGPSLSQSDRDAHPQITFLPPVGKGDVLRVLKEHDPQYIGIIDGFFGSRPAVMHKEILQALSGGCHVYGAASMGALRASELATYGMIGVGEIFEAYHDGTLESDAEVAVNHGPAEVGFPAVSVAQVDVKATLDALKARGMLTAHEAQDLLEKSNAIYYPDRNWRSIAQAKSGDRAAFKKLESQLSQAHVQRKRLDAIALLARISKDQIRDLAAVMHSLEPPLAPSYKRFRQSIVGY